MPQPQTHTRTWNELTNAEKGAIIRMSTNPPGMYNQFSDADLGGDDPSLGVLWPVVQDPGTGNILSIEDAGNELMSELRSQGSPIMGAVDGGTYQEGMSVDYTNNPQDYSNNNAADPSTGYGSYDPNRGLTSTDFENFTGVNAGNTIDLTQYGPNEQEAADYAAVRDLANQAGQRDINRFAIDPSTLMPIDTYTYDPALADVYGVDPSNSFNDTRGAADYAYGMNNYAADINGTTLQDAAQLQAAAARGDSPLFSDARLSRDADRMFQQQMQAAARARGSSSAGLAANMASQNALFGQHQLVNDANASRLQEMAQARQAYGDIGAQIRQGDIQTAQQAVDIGNLLYGVNSQELSADTQNAAWQNQGAQYNTGQANEAAQFNVGQEAQAGAANAQQYYNTLTGNRDTAIGQQDRADNLVSGYTDKVLGIDSTNNANRITAEQNFDESARNRAAVLANTYNGVATNQTQLTGQRMANESQKNASILGAVGTVAGAIGAGAIAASDERMKNVRGSAKPADFTKIREKNWTYNEEDPSLEGQDGIGGMADEYPEDVVVRRPDGYLGIDMKKAVMRLSGALGDAQRRMKKAGI